MRLVSSAAGVAKCNPVVVQVLDVSQRAVGLVIIEQPGFLGQGVSAATRRGDRAVVAGLIEVASSLVRLEYPLRTAWACNCHRAVAACCKRILPIVRPAASKGPKAYRCEIRSPK